MGVKEDCEALAREIFGAASASKVYDFPDDPELCIESTKKLFSSMLGEDFAEEKIAPLRKKYLPSDKRSKENTED